MFENIVVVGASGGIGGAFVKVAADLYPEAILHAISRQPPRTPVSRTRYLAVDYTSEASIAGCAVAVAKNKPPDLVIVATGLLHDNGLRPEKSLQDISAEKFRRLFEANTIVPALFAKYFIPGLDREKPALFAVLSARVGSITDNRLGGWYGYRASKAALNMIVKNAAIETARRNKQAVIVGLHPGTVDSRLSKPFQSHVPAGKLFTPAYSAQKLLRVLQTLGPEQSGDCFAWDGSRIEA